MDSMEDQDDNRENRNRVNEDGIDTVSASTFIANRKSKSSNYDDNFDSSQQQQ